jgi:hypothetical protein
VSGNGARIGAEPERSRTRALVPAPAPQPRSGWRRIDFSRGLELALRASAVPLMIGYRAAAGVPERRDRSVPVPRPSFGLRAKMALDELFLGTEVFTAPVVGAGEVARLGRELREALALYEERGWLEEPARYHAAPPALEGARLDRATSPLGGFRRLRYESGWEPHAGEPGRRRWLGHRANRTAHAWLLEHPGPARPWVVCIPGYRMGTPLVDFTGFRAHWMHRRLGVNVAIPVMPLHGPRAVGARGGDGFLRGDFVDTLHAQAQAVWDARRLIAWLRREGAPAVGAHGVSLGAYTAALLACLEPLDCVIAGVPTTCFVDLVRAHMPRVAWRALELLGVDFAGLERMLRVVSPLAMPPRVPRGRRFLYAGACDRLAPPEHAALLWRHWGRPRIAWYAGGHVSFLFEPAVKRLVRGALETSGFVQARA